MPQWRITKFDPHFRDRRGHYVREEWTDVSQIGQSIGGRVFTVDEYLNVESKYVNAVTAFLTETGVASVQVCSLQVDLDFCNWLRPNGLDDLAYLVHSIFEGRDLCVDDVGLVLRGILRGIIWCTLEAPRKAYVCYVGDMYLNIGSTETCEKSITFAKSLGLEVQVLTKERLGARRDWPTERD